MRIGEQCLGLGDTIQDCLIKCAHAFSSYFHHTDEDFVDGNSAPCSSRYWGWCEWRNNGAFAFRRNECQMFNLASPFVLSHPEMKVFPCLDQRMTPSAALCTPQNRELFPASFLFRTESLVSHSVTISLFPEPRHLTRERFNDAIYIHWILIGLNSNAVSTFWITAININVITCQF